MQYTWINILHWYQPPTIEHETLEQVVEESYRPLLDFLLQEKEYRVTINITACLTYLLHEHGYESILEKLKTLIEREQVELLGSAAFHPILPLITSEEVAHQIKVQEQINKQYLQLPEDYQPQGFFLPECAYSTEVGSSIRKLGYKWIVLDEISHTGTVGNLSAEKKYTIQESGLGVVFRNRELSRSYVPDSILQNKKEQILPKIFITATDAELYWHRHKDLDGALYKVVTDKDITTTTVSEYLSQLTATEQCDPVESNWDSTPQELQNNIPYAQWLHPDNELHTKLWKLANTAYDAVTQHKDAEHHWAARLHLERGMSSCTFWWASGKDFNLFSGPAWKPDEVERGANELIRAIRSLPLSKELKISAEHLYIDILKTVWHQHWERSTN